ncbi:MAG: hypothetical protein L0Y67_04090 [Gammaproteobacteria bacterium]|nr:hypothetical protein [Gammaproteobacteria bacterium]MCI0590774.1 hypothetical protein [Gammaproteobacteria bacterium]
MVLCNRAFSFLIVLLCLLSPSLGAYTQGGYAEGDGGQFSNLTLKGIDTVTLRINGMSPDYKRYGIDKARWEKIMTERLQNAGLKVVTYDEALRTPNAALVQLDLFVNYHYAYYSYGILLAVRHKVPLPSTAQSFVSDTIWSEYTNHYARNTDLGTVNGYIQTLLDHFIAAYHAQNAG